MGTRACLLRVSGRGRRLISASGLVAVVPRLLREDVLRLAAVLLAVLR